MITTLRDLARTLSAQTLTVEDVVDQLDGEQIDMTANVMIEKPALAGVAQVNVVRSLQSEEPAYVTLELSEPLSEGELEAAFGTPRRVEGDHLGQPDRLVYHVDLPQRPYAVALIATADEEGARTVTLRRDIRLG